jgi:hypothetical protein
MDKAKLRLESLENRETPTELLSSGGLVTPTSSGPSDSRIAPQDPVIIEPDITIILPGDKK